MTSFAAAGDPGLPATDTTSFAAGGILSDDLGGNDTTVVLELGGRKYTKSDLAKKITHADEHIARLSAESEQQRKLLAETNELIKKQLTATELLAKLKQEQTMALPVVTHPAGDGVKGLTMEEVKSVLAQEASVAADSAKKAVSDSNWKNVTEALTKAFGSTVDQEVARVVQANEMSMAQAADLARNSPKAFLSLFGNLGKKAQPSLLGRGGSVNPLAALKSEGPRASSGFITASLRDSMSILKSRYQELGL